MKNFESKTIETICIEITISEKKWCILFAQRPLNVLVYFDKQSFFEAWFPLGVL